MSKMPEWKQLQELIANDIKDIDKYARSTKGSGNQGECGDVKNSIGLNIECKDENKINVYQEKYLKHCEEEIPLHSKKIAIVVTRNKNGKIRVHLDKDDFFKIYKEWFNGINKGIAS